MGGKLSGRRFAGPRGDRTRPTSERVREAIASALEARDLMSNAAVLDLFAGTGALSFEALSRGAARATLIDGDRRVAKAIERSARELGLSDAVTVRVADLEGDPGRWLESVTPPFDLVFCDPPYARVDQVERLLDRLGRASAFAAETTFVLEHARGKAPTLPDEISPIRTYRYGDTEVLLASTSEGER